MLYLSVLNIETFNSLHLEYIHGLSLHSPVGTRIPKIHYSLNEKYFFLISVLNSSSLILKLWSLILGIPTTENIIPARRLYILMKSYFILLIMRLSKHNLFHLFSYNINAKPVRSLANLHCNYVSSLGREAWLVHNIPDAVSPAFIYFQHDAIILIIKSSYCTCTLLTVILGGEKTLISLCTTFFRHQ